MSGSTETSATRELAAIMFSDVAGYTTINLGFRPTSGRFFAW